MLNKYSQRNVLTEHQDQSVKIVLVIDFRVNTNTVLILWHTFLKTNLFIVNLIILK